MDYGADITLKNAYGETSLHYAARSNSVELVDLLLRYKQKDPSDWATYKGRNEPLHLAAQYGNVGVIMKLLDYKANIHAKNAYHLPPLLLAKSPEAAKVLLMADPVMADKLAEKKKGKLKKGTDKKRRV